MAIAAGAPKGAINVTPMIDILLVLLIIFMVVVHSESQGLEARAPQPPQGPAIPNPQDIVLLVRDDFSVTLNNERVDQRDLESRLTQLSKTRGNPVIFVGANADLPFDPVLHVIDVARGAGLTRVALLPKGGF